MSSEGALGGCRDFAFKLDASLIRKIAFSRESIVSQCFVEVIELSGSSSAAAPSTVVQDGRFSSALRELIEHSINQARTGPGGGGQADLHRVLVCMVVPSGTGPARACSMLASLQQLYLKVFEISGFLLIQ